MDTDEREQPTNHTRRQHPYLTAARPTTSASSNETILNTLLEKANNLERASNATMIRAAIKEALKEQCRSEKETRYKTLTFNTSNAQSAESIMEAVLDWTTKSSCGPPAFRVAKDQVFVQMASIKDKESLVDFFKVSGQDTPLAQALIKPLPNGLFFERLPVKLEINNVTEAISADKVKNAILLIIQHNPRAKLIQLKDGKVHAKTKKRTISLKVNGEAVYHLIIQMKAIIPIMLGKNRTNLYLRVNCRPWQCGNCHAIGYHPSCPGKLCANCGSGGHQAKECQRKTRFCRTCNKPGHRAKDFHCPRFLNEVAKEIRKHDFPIEILTDQEMIGALLKQIQLG